MVWIRGRAAPPGRTFSQIVGWRSTRRAGSISAPVLHYASSAMPAPAEPSRRIARFGVFELDIAAGELRKNGVKLRLQEQPLQVLALLLERAGSVVTREELRQRLWPADTFVDFDHSLNTAVNKLREALGDSASSPRYIETLARRGYRFIAPVQSPPTANPPHGDADTRLDDTRVAADTRGDADARVATGTLARPASEAIPLHPDLEVPIPHRALTRGLFILIQIMYVVFYLSALFRLHAVIAIGESFLPAWGATALAGAVMVTAGAGIPLRCYLISAVAFDYRRLGEKFRAIFPFILALDQLWAIAPFLLLQKIGLGAAFAATAALLYVPFGERTLIRMAYLATLSRE